MGEAIFFRVATNHHVLRRLYWLEADERDLHGKDGAERVDGRVCHVHPMGKPTANHQYKNVHWNQIDQEHVTAPRGNLHKSRRKCGSLKCNHATASRSLYHVEVGHSTKGRPIDLTCLNALNPEVIGQQHAEDGDSLIVVRAGYGPARTLLQCNHCV